MSPVDLCIEFDSGAMEGRGKWRKRGGGRGRRERERKDGDPVVTTASQC